MNRISRFTLASALTLILALSASAESRKPIEKKETGKEPTTEKDFVVKAVECEVCAVKVSEYVAKNAANAEVRKFAQHIVDDHTKTRDAMLDRARDMKVGVVEGLDKDRQQKFDDLRKLKGNDFDREYLRGTIEAHEQGMRMYEKWSTNAKDEKIRETAKKASATMRDHLDHARKLLNSLKS